MRAGCKKEKTCCSATAEFFSPSIRQLECQLLWEVGEDRRQKRVCGTSVRDLSRRF